MSELVLPARLVGRQLRIGCGCCNSVHVDDAFDPAPPNRCRVESFSARVGYTPMLVDDIADDAALVALAVDCWLLGAGWRSLPRGRWSHPWFGLLTLERAALAQRALDATHVHALDRDPHQC